MSKPLYEKFDPVSYLEIALGLPTDASVALIRTAADRAYYAAFLTCRDLLKAKNYISPQYNRYDHETVAETLKRPDVLGNIGNNENRLRRSRNCITYDTRILQITHNDARSLAWMIATARDLIERVQKLPECKSNTQLS
jgi:uncharacterized protein (UPF0332 family)